ncbi:restriction endonuclease subunit S [Fusicatenibacter sp.]
MKIKDICEAVTDGSHNPPQGISSSGYMMLSSKNIFDDEITFEEPRYLSEDDFLRENKRTKISEGDVLLTIVGTVGRTAVVDGDMPSFTLQRSVAVLHPKRNICISRFLMYALRGKHRFIENRAKGVAQKGIYLGEVSEIDISIPDINEQKVIVEKLDKICDIIKLRKQELTNLDELMKARFVEMFGTYPANEKRWNVGTIRDVVTEVRYGSSRKAAEGMQGQYLYLRMNNITYSGELVLNDIKTIDVPEKELLKCSVQRGDVLFNRTNSKELVGKTCVYNRDEMMVLAGFIIRVRVNEKILPEILSTFLNTDFSKKMLYGMCKSAIGQANINAQEFQNIEIYIPDMKSQEQFVEFKKQIDKSKVAVQKALDETQLLFDSLMQEYFG